jgi:ArsR family transcriptional regulator
MLVAGDEDLASLAKAIAHPARILILRLLASRKACICGDIVSELLLAQSTVSEHLRILKTVGLVIGEVDGPRVCYCINVDTLGQLKTLVRDLPCPDTTYSPEKCQED